ncbi:sensor histidine kinase [Proteiniborus sp. MB09-C3]|uniref:ATP-binding protein n=1 Tax=Proteiniborus sp. MB09-C3 TaxID=3050072 RepID=UPI00255586BC|nr:sensor histidine kinase [Proteiniborus sp. MB09-C3]WIV13390.1 sensor histidine kinase [Proteiniborus sp. MB09-C3]
MKLQYKITIVMTLMLIAVIGGIGILTFRQVEKTIEHQMGNNAMDLAVTIASMDVIKETLGTTKDYRIIQDKIESFKHETRFNYIIVMDMDGIKYSYPIEYDLGKKYISGGEERVLKYGESYISADKNVLISAIRAFVPVHYNGKQVGAVLVGLLNNTVYEEIRPYILNFQMTIVIGIIVGIICSAILSYNIKKSIFGLEPKEIALLLGQRDNILQSLKNGIMAVDEKGSIILLNKNAKDVLGFKDSDVGKNISSFNMVYTRQIAEVLENEESIYNEEVRLGPQKILLCSHTIMKNYRNETIGLVSSFQDLSEVKRMAEELTGIKKMTNELRAQSHEFSNKLHTISGLIQLEEYDKAIKYISDLTEQRHEILGTLTYKIKDVHIAGILLSKYNKAVEAKIEMIIDSNSSLTALPEEINVDEVCSILGNLIDNAIDELVKVKSGKLLIKINSNTNALKIMVKDNGPGISEDIRDKIYRRGYTTKSGCRGFGLSIVKKIVDGAGGTIELKSDDGTCWEITIPMRRGN